MINVHHLELFYFVAKYEGITAAVRRMPYGIQQPAVSGQLLQLEKNLGVKLFHRRPFSLTPPGEELYDFVYPFFSRLPDIAGRLKGEEERHLRLAAASMVLTNHLPAVLESLRAEVPDLRLTLRDFLPAGVEEALLTEEVDIAISVIPPKPAPGIKVEPLLELPLILLAPKTVKAKTLKKILAQADEACRIQLPLIAVPRHEALTTLFHEGLTDRGFQWESTIEANSLDLVRAYAEQGYGYGLTVDAPGDSCNLERIELDRFPKLKIGLLHRGKLKPLAQSFVDQVRRYAKDVLKIEPPK